MLSPKTSKALYTTFFLLAVTTSACVNLSTPEKTLGTAGNAIKNKNLKNFATTLSPELAQTLANFEPMEEISQKLAPFKKVILEDRILQSTETRANGDVETSYSIKVVGIDRADIKILVYRTEVSCLSPEVFHPAQPGICYPHPNGREHCERDQPAYTSIETNCRITGLLE